MPRLAVHRSALAVASIVVLPALALLAPSCATSSPPDPASVTFGDVALILEAHCVECHSGDEPEGELDLTTHAALMRGGESGRVIVPGNASRSLMIRLVERTEKPFMPMKARKLARRDIDTLRAWVDGGARPSI